MGRGVRRRPMRLADKLRQIRDDLGLTQEELLDHFGLTQYVNRGEVSDFERGVREPDLLTLKAFAEGAGVYVDDLIGAALDLPEALPAVQHVTGTGAKPPTKRLRAHINTTVVTLLLKIENDSNRWRGDNRARRGIEKSHL